jgi:hypothetical protein
MGIFDRKDKGAKSGAPTPSNEEAKTAVGPLKDAKDELDVANIKVAVDAKNRELVSMVAKAGNPYHKEGTEFSIARVHVEKLVKQGWAEEV